MIQDICNWSSIWVIKDF